MSGFIPLTPGIMTENGSGEEEAVMINPVSLEACEFGSCDFLLAVT